MGLKRVEGGLMAFLDQTLNLRVNLLRGSLRAGELGAATQVTVTLLAKSDHAKLIAHTKLGDHGAGDGGCLLDIVACTTRHLAEDDLLGGAATA